ncbi:accessory gene regulator B family protein [Anaerocolumna sp. AGMB13020]|uniref:accessory gene regulator B family protein n=1 Tax=Anaerocolumna sp. AGMB13020 TaxID=3081750 RepID=UPI002954926F|nr:accessory gene regulator B family protein [Anaerocolumna sp. AGMB13020]WOO38586.1 accessory gene regulator B family protein [Anaerocolumna sp. AGMB13020]
MIIILAKKLTERVIKDSIISKEQQKLYQYSYELLISSFINIIIVLFLGGIFHKTIETILFLLFFCSLKKYTGGLHMSTYNRCICLFSFLYTVILILDYFTVFHNPQIILILVIASSCIISTLSPIVDVNKPLSAQEIKMLKRKEMIILPVQLVVYLSFYCIVSTYLSKYVGIAIITTAFLVLTGYINNKIKEGKTYDKYSNL